MKIIKKIGSLFLIIAFVIFNATLFVGEYELSKEDFTQFTQEKGITSSYFIEHTQKEIVWIKYQNPIQLSSEILRIAQESHQHHRKIIEQLQLQNASEEAINAEWSKVIWLSSIKQNADFAYPLVLKATKGLVVDYAKLFLGLTFGLGLLGGILFFLPNIQLNGPAGIKNNGIFQNAATNKGWVAWLVLLYLVIFYIVLYFFPNYISNWIYISNPVSLFLSGNNASQWFLYGLMYCTFMLVMGIRMYIKYRHNAYQMLRTTSVLFFQLAFAFFIPEMLVKLNQPWYDFKNAWPLNYTFFFDWNIKQLLANGNMGLFMLFWGIALTLIIVPLFTYLYGKRWYCSWVCGCGGLAETAGDPYRQLSDKSLKSWQYERYIIHGVLVFAIFMTIGTVYTFFTEDRYLLGFINTEELRFWYGFGIGSVFSGVIGTGFYPIFGNRVWCRFGCPLAAYLGFVQRFKSRFRITTNGNQCISCGNCSTYCEQGIDVRWYAQRQQNIIRSSCVGCGVCSAVCPRGVLKLENGPENSRFNDPDKPIFIQNGEFKINL